MNKELYAYWKTLSGKEAIDQYYANYEIDPFWLTPDGNPTEEQIRMVEDYDEAIRQMRIVDKLEADITKNLDQTLDLILEVMRDPAFEAMGNKLIAALNTSRKIMTDILNEKREEIEILTYGFCPFVE